MKKIFTISFLIFTILLSLLNNSYAATPTLEQIVNAFNNCEIVKRWANSESGNSFLASNNDTTLTITMVMSNETTEVVYSLDGDILSTTLTQDNIAGAMASMYLIDSIGQLHGYEDGELLATLNSEETMNYTLDNDGYEIKQFDNKDVSIKVDITKKIPLVDFSNTYIEVSDLKNLKEYISGDGSAEKSKGNIYFHKDGYDGEYTLIVAEKNELTENTYKSILSILEVMFDSEEPVSYFQNNFPNLSTSDKELQGIKVEINPQKNDWEETLLDSDDTYKFVRLTIDKNSVIDSLNIDNNNISNVVTNTGIVTNNKQPINTNIINNIIINSIDKLPQTGNFFNIKDGLVLLIIAATIFLTFIVIKDIKYKNINK